MMIRSIMAVFCLAMAVAVVPVSAERVDGIVAVVGNEPILHSELVLEIAPELNMMTRSSSGSDDFQAQYSALMDRALNDAVNNRILLRLALLSGRQVTDEEIDEDVERIRAQYTSTEEFLGELAASGETMADIRERRRKQLMALRMSAWKRMEFEREVVISESEVAQYYRDNIKDFMRPERVRLRQILLERPSEGAERATVKARMEQLRDELETGADFGELAAAHSEGVGAAQGGIIGWTLRGDFVEPLDSAAFDLQAGEYSPTLETSNAFHVLYAEAREDAGTASLDEVRVVIEPELRRAGAAERYQRWMVEQRKRSRVQVFN
jgi:parvulin-like peptidyl-prolyl isomerase